MAKVLIAEDDEKVLKIISKVLTTLGHETQLCLNGQEAYDLIQKEEFDLLITDIMMPNMNGQELIHKIRDHSKFNKLRFIVISGSVNSSQFQDVEALGALIYVPKPLSIDNLISAIKMILGN